MTISYGILRFLEVSCLFSLGEGLAEKLIRNGGVNSDLVRTLFDKTFMSRDILCELQSDICIVHEGIKLEGFISVTDMPVHLGL